MKKRAPVCLSRSASLHQASHGRKYYFHRHSRMGGRSEGESDAIAFIFADDSANWAAFLQNKLRSDSYKIQSYLHQEPNQNYVPELFSSTQACVVLVSPFLLETQHSMFWTRCVERFHHRTVIVFLGVDQEDLRLNLGTSLTQRILSHICLEVDGSKETVSSALVKMIEVYESSDNSSLHSLREDCAPVEDEDEESNDGIYDYPPQPRQQNCIVRVMPPVLYETDSRDVLILMEREADGKLTMVLDSGCGPSGHIPMEHIASSAYLATLPSDIVGKVNFMVLSQDENNMGKASLHVYSRMEQLCHLLQKEASPLTQLCRVLGVSGTRSSETDELDSLLARRLAFSQFPPGLKNLLYGEEQSAAADHGTSQWPTLLHFAAEFNLTRVCEELLRYPGTIHAACLENCDGIFPSQLAEKNGFSALQKRLVQYVEDMRLRRSAADSGISFSENLPAPSPHSSQGHMYVNEMPPLSDLPDRCNDPTEDYVDMSGLRLSCHGGQRVVLSTCQEGSEGAFVGDTPQNLPAPAPCFKKLHDGYAKPRSYSEGCVKTPYAKTPSEARIAEEDSKENDPPPLKPKVGRSRSSASTYISQAQFSAAERRPDSSSSETSDSLQVTQDGSSCKSSTETLTYSESEPTSGSDLKSDEHAGGVSWNLDSSRWEDRPASQASTASSLSDFEAPLGQAGASADDTPVLRGKNKRSKSVQDKISHFFKKIKSPRRLLSSSESDLPTKGQKKAVVYSRQSTASTSSDPSGYKSSTSRLRCSESERDSGALCDDHGSLVMMRSKEQGTDAARNSGKRNGLSMQRRVSVRVQRAKNEDLSETPTLPARESTAETFVSFIK